MPKETASTGLFRFSVTEDDIEKATRNNSVKCVVAQCIARTLPTATRIEVDVQTVRWTLDNDRYVFLCPYSVQGYVVAFDAGEVLEPFTFALDLRKRIPVGRSTLTEAGLAIHRARSKTWRARQAKRKAEERGVPEEVSEAARTLARAERHEADVKAEHRGPEEQTQSGRRSVPRVHKTTQRSYGHRIYRVNQ